MKYYLCGYKCKYNSKEGLCMRETIALDINAECIYYEEAEEDNISICDKECVYDSNNNCKE